jgi:hypothetical protein
LLLHFLQTQPLASAAACRAAALILTRGSTGGRFTAARLRKPTVFLTSFLLEPSLQKVP